MKKTKRRRGKPITKGHTPRKTRTLEAVEPGKETIHIPAVARKLERAACPRCGKSETPNGRIVVRCYARNEKASYMRCVLCHYRWRVDR